MRRIAVINQKGGVGKTTTVVNLGAALARAGRGTVVVDLDPQANLSLHLDVEVGPGEPSSYTLLHGECSFAQALRPTPIRGLWVLPSHIDLSGAEMELASAIGRENLLRDAIERWRSARAPADYVLFDCPPSLSLLSVNALSAADEVIIALQTEFMALQGMSKLLDIIELLKSRLNPRLELAGILPTMYDSRLKLAREVLAEIRKYFPGKVFPQPIRTNVKLAEASSHARTIFEYAPDSHGAEDYEALARTIIEQEAHGRAPQGDLDTVTLTPPPAPGTAPAARPQDPSEHRPPGKSMLL